MVGIVVIADLVRQRRVKRLVAVIAVSALVFLPLVALINSLTGGGSGS